MTGARRNALGTVLGLICIADVAHAQPGVGTWVRKDADPRAGTMTMTVEVCCGRGRKLTYNITMSGTSYVMTVESPFDGTEVPVLMDGKPRGETMAITLVDSHHTSTIVRMNGQLFGTSKATLSSDGKTLTVVNDIKGIGGPQPKGVQTEVWIKK